MAPRETVLQIRLSTKEKQIIKKSAKNAGMSMGAWIRFVLLQADISDLLAPPKKGRSAR